MQFFSGYLRDNLNSIIYSPVEGSDTQTADQFTELGYYTWDKGNGYATFLDAADESMKAGMSLCGIQMDYSKDFVNGDISFFKRTYNSFYLDPTFESIDLKDCAFAITRDLIDRNLIKQLLPFIDPKVIDDIQSSYRDEKFLSFHPNFTTLMRNRNIMAYDQYYRRTTRKRKFLVDLDSSFYRDITDLSSEETAKLKGGVKRIRDLREVADNENVDPQQMPPRVEIRTVERPYMELNIMLNGQPVYLGEDKTGIVETFPFVPVMCYFEPSIWMPSQRIQGISATLWSAQRQFNKRHMKIVDMMDTSISTGYKYLLGSVPDPKELQQSGQNKLVGVDPEAPGGLDAVQELQGANVSPALVEYQGILDQLTLTLANVNESVLGVDEKGNTQISGRLAEVRIGQGLRSNRKLFDNIETSQQLLGGLVLKAMQNHYTPGKVKRILGEEPTPQFYDQEFEQYDAVIKEGVRSKSQKDAYYYELVNLKREGIVDVPESEIVNALEVAGISQLKEAVEAQAKQRSEQQQELGQKQIAVLDATAAEKYGLAGERKSRERSNIGLADERESEAIQNQAQATLDRARTITEISQLGDDRILKVLQFVNTLEQQEEAKRQQQKAEIEAQASDLEASAEGNKQEVNQQ